MNNSLMSLTLYRDGGGWSFDDAPNNVVREPFVAGAPEIIDALAEAEGLSGRKKLRMIFSAHKFPGAHELVWLRGEFAGNIYGYKGQEGWLCPTLYVYFKSAPKKLYVKVSAPLAGQKEK